MPTLRRAALAAFPIAALALAAPAALAADAPGGEPPLVRVQAVPGTAVPDAGTALAPAGHREPGTVIYVYPTSPSTFVPVVGLPSFIVQPGAPLPEVATHVVHSVVVPHWGDRRHPLGDLDCSNFEGTVRIVPPDVNGLDPDGDGLGCEAGER